MTHNIIYTPRKTSLSETGSRSLTSELSVQRPEGASYGGSQTWFSSPSIRGYGCGLIAAHDLLWYLERKESLTAQTDRHRSGEQLVSDSLSWEDYERSVKRLHRLFPILPRLGINGLMLSEGLNLVFLLRRLPYRACWHIGYRNTGKEISQLLGQVKFYNMEVDIDEHLESPYKGLYIIGDGSGVTHSLSHASASGVYVARRIAETL